MELTTVADDFAVLHDGESVHRFTDLASGQVHVLAGVEVATLARPAGALLCKFATVNDVHFGETVCGILDGDPAVAGRRRPAGTTPYPELMNAAAADEMAAIEPAAVVVKGDLTVDGTHDEFAAFEACYRSSFGERLWAVRGNHDAYRGQQEYAGDQTIELPGVTVALVDTVIPTKTTGRFDAAQAEWLRHVASAARRAGRVVMVMGHHQNWAGGRPSPEYFGINPPDSERLASVIAAEPAIVAYAAGHTHRHRVRTMAATGSVPFIEVGCVKDFPGTWAEYRVYETAIMQVVHRISAPEPLAWSEECRDLYVEYGVEYATYALAERCFVIAHRQSRR
jgi:3',5'-cyclic-AMP phosphodiesterase